VAAGIYEAWYRQLGDSVSRAAVPADVRPFFRTLGTARVVAQLVTPGSAFGGDPARARDALLVNGLAAAVADLTQRFGADQSKWVYGQPSYHYALIRHPLSAAVSPEMRAKLDVALLRAAATKHRDGDGERRQPDVGGVVPDHRRPE
jgi:penicillin amidase